jgi:hypothetical protein
MSKTARMRRMGTRNSKDGKNPSERRLTGRRYFLCWARRSAPVHAALQHTVALCFRASLP